ncbi:hypothetical protein OPV09_13140 [Janthinobacterium sp. TB1-E2]|uniref:Uncharacterized protein n=1 Tax=Janthinobacterium aestuarii TaxID=2985511 RepID=A0ABZ2GWY3_9BURK
MQALDVTRQARWNGCHLYVFANTFSQLAYASNFRAAMLPHVNFTCTKKEHSSDQRFSKIQFMWQIRHAEVPGAPPHAAAFYATLAAPAFLRL